MESRGPNEKMGPNSFRLNIPSSSSEMKHVLSSRISNKQYSMNGGKNRKATNPHNRHTLRRNPQASNKRSLSIHPTVTTRIQIHTSNLEGYSLCTSLFDSSRLIENKTRRSYEDQETQVVTSPSPTTSEVIKHPLVERNISQHETVRSLRYKQREIITSRIVSGEINHTKELLLEYSTYSLQTRRIRVPTVKKRDTSVIAELTALSGMVKKQLSRRCLHNEHSRRSPFTKAPPGTLI